MLDICQLLLLLNGLISRNILASHLYKQALVFCFSFLKSITQLSEEQRADMTQLEMVMTQEFVGQQLILLVGCLDTSEEGGRSDIAIFCRKHLADVF